MNILDRLSEHARERTEQAKRKRPFESLQAEALALPRGDFAFERALKKEGLAFICECKKASPSKGLIAEHFPYLEIARDFEAAGAEYAPAFQVFLCLIRRKNDQSDVAESKRIRKRP